MDEARIVRDLLRFQIFYFQFNIIFLSWGLINPSCQCSFLFIGLSLLCFSKILYCNSLLAFKCFSNQKESSNSKGCESFSRFPFLNPTLLMKNTISAGVSRNTFSAAVVTICPVGVLYSGIGYRFLFSKALQKDPKEDSRFMMLNRFMVVFPSW